MSDNVTANAGSGGATFASDDIGGVQYPRTKMAIGADGSATDLAFGQATMANSLPVTLASNQGAITVASHAVTNAGTFAVQSAQTGTWSVSLTDGTDTADILDLTNSNPLTVAIVDTNGDQIASFGGGTQYTEDAAAAANPVGTALIMVRADSLAGLTTANGDNVAGRGTDKGELYVKHVDAIPITDNSGSITVDGTVSVTGVATAANQTTIIGHVDGIEGLLTTIDSDTSALAAAISGTEVQVDVVGALPAGTNNIGDVDVLSVVPGTGATSLGKAEDAAHSSGDTGVMALAVRQDADASFAGTSGDYAPLQLDDNGFLKVNIKAGAGSGGTASTDDAAFTAGSGSGTPMMGFVTADSVDSGDVGVVGMLANRQLKVTLYDSGGVELAVGGGTQYTEDAAAAANPVGNALIVVREDARAGGLTSADGDNVALRGNNKGELYVKHTDALDVNSHAVTNAGTFAVQASQSGTWNIGTVTPGTAATNLGKAEDAAHSSGDVGVMALSVRQDTAAALGGTDADYQPLITDASGRLHVNVGNTVTVGSHAVTNAGTFAVQVDGSALTALQKIDDPVLVDDAAFTPATSSVMMAGFQADESSTDSVDEGDAGAARMTLDRKVIVNPQPHTAGGLSIFRSLDLDETEEDVKASAGNVYSVWVTNTATSTRFLKFYNATAANVTVGSTMPVITIGIPGNSSDDISGKFDGGGMGIFFDTAICVAATTGVADADTGAPAANDVIVNIFYK